MSITFDTTGDPRHTPARPNWTVWRGSGLRVRWHLLALSLAMLLPVLSFAAIEVLHAAAAQRQSDVAQMQLTALSNADRVEQGLTAMRATAAVLANSPDLRSRDLAGFRRAADEVARSAGVIVVLRDPGGRQIINSRAAPGEPLPTLPAEDVEGRQAVKADRTFVSDLFTTGIVHPFMARVIAPASFGGSGAAETGYSVEIEFTPELVQSWLPANARGPDWIVTVVGQNGIVIARTEALDTYVGRGSARDELGPIINVAGTWRGLQVDGSWLSGSYTRLRAANWIVTVGRPENVLSPGLVRNLVWLMMTAMLLVGLGTMLSGLLARRLARGVEMLVEAAHTLGAGVPVPRAALPVREFQDVRQALVAAGLELRTRTASEHALLVEIRRSRDLLQAVVDGTGDPIFARDLHGRFVVMNQAGARSLGVARADQVEGQTVETLLSPEQRSAARGWDWLAGVSVETMTMPLSLLDGQAGSGRLYQVSKAPWRDPSGEVAGMVCIARDVTDQTEAEARLQALQANLARAGRLSAVAAMAAGLAHELNQPLAAATNFMAAADALLARCSPEVEGDRAAVQEALSEASDQVVRAASIVRRLRAFIGKKEVVTEDQCLAPLIEEAAQAAWRHGAPGTASLHFQLDPSVYALVDPVQVQQVVSNLVRNAAEAMRTSPGLPRQEVWVGVNRTEDGNALVSVIDTGPGLDTVRRDRLFDVLEGSSKPGGMGVGLAICRTIVAAHGGQLWAEDTEGGGASFLFTLPPALALQTVLSQTERVDELPTA